MKSASGIAIIGTGHHLPSHIEDNETLCRNLSITPEWIIEKTGIKRRYLAQDKDAASDFALQAARNAMQRAAVSASDIDLIICCTFSADYEFPALSAKIHKELGVKGGQIFDLQANCAGFVSGMTAASDRMQLDSTIRNALVIGVEINSRYINRHDADTAIYCSDGAGAVILGRTKDAGIIASSFYTDSSNYEAVRHRGGGSSFPKLHAAFDPTTDFMEINGLATWKQAITHLPSVIRNACEKAEIDVKAIDFLIFHQANLRLIEYIMGKMRVAMDKTYTNIAEIGNTGAASVAIALSEAVEKGMIKHNDTVVFAAVGAGFNFAANVWKWSSPRQMGE